MQASNHLTALRNAYRAAFDDYTEESRRLAQLLIHLEDAADITGYFEVNEQEERLYIAQGRYEEARMRYMRHVLCGFTLREDSMSLVH